jgi:hypothetical protein
MTSLYVDPSFAPDELLARLYAGDLVVFTSIDAVSELVDHTREALNELFDGADPLDAHQRHTPEDMAAALGVWKPKFIHDPRSIQLVAKIVEEAGLALGATHVDVPKPRTSFPVGHLTTGIAFAFPWHRDSWYGAPPQQINWWLPIYDIGADNAMEFDTASFAKAVPNDSADFDYYQLNAKRFTVAKQVHREEQVRPRAIDHEVADPLVVLMRPGSILLFAGAHLHASIANTSPVSRYSVDFRTVDVADVLAGRGAPFVDVECTGTALRDFRNAATGEPFAEDVVRKLYGDPPADAMLVFGPTAQDQGEPE